MNGLKSSFSHRHALIPAPGITSRPPNGLKLQLASLSAFHFRWSPDHHHTIFSARIFAQSHHPLHELMKRRYDVREATQPLWWSVNCSTKIGGKKKTVRSWLTSRLKVAVVKALEEEGFTKDGRPLKGRGKNLVGTANLTIQPPLLGMRIGEVEEQTRRAVKHLKYLSYVGRIPAQHSGPKSARKAKANHKAEQEDDGEWDVFDEAAAKETKPLLQKSRGLPKFRKFIPRIESENFRRPGNY